MTELKPCPKCGSVEGKQVWDTRYDIERQISYECYTCGYKEEDHYLINERKAYYDARKTLGTKF